MREVFAATAELKFVGEPDAGEVTGYGSVFNVMDWHGDMVAPGAFDDTLAEQKAAGRVIPMYGQHSFALLGGDPYPIGMWTDIQPDEKGLRVRGKFIGLQHPDVSRVLDLVKAGVIPGMSIAFKVRPNGAVQGKKAGEPKRLLKSVDLYSIDLVGDPANPHATIDGVKAMLQMPNHKAAADALEQAHQMCMDCMSGGDAPTSDERNQITDNLRTAYKHLTGSDMPMKMQFEQLREFKKWLHAPVDQGGRGFTNSQADELAQLVFKFTPPRDESGDDSAAASAARKQAVGEIRSLLSGFSLKLGA